MDEPTPGAEASRSALRFRAGSLRLALAVLAMSVIPAMAPQPVSYFWCFSAYAACAIAVQVAIWMDRGAGNLRALLMGIVDYATITYVVHQLGSAPSPLFGIYIFVGLVYALVIERRVAIALSVIGATMYGALLMAEHRGWLPYAPNAPHWADTVRPPVEMLWSSAALGYLMTVGSTLVVGQLATALRAREAELERLSKRDPLTGLYNRRYLLDVIAGDLARVRRGDKLAVAMLDLDNFKRVNDALGHQQGDLLLQRIAAAMRAATREVDVVGRLGGDELLVLLPLTGLDAARTAAARLLACVREVGAGAYPVTASLGLTAATASDDAESLLKRADDATYAAKRAGGDRMVIG